MRFAVAVTLPLAIVALSAVAKMPPPSEEAKAKADEAKAKSTWTEKSEAYKLCVVQDRIAAAYRKTSAGAGKPVPVALTTPPCVDPGPYVAAAPANARPLEASEAHSPAETGK